MDRSIILPAIRTHLWENLYNSIQGSYKGSWEIIFVGPNYPPESLKAKANVKHIKSFASPLVCRQIALCAAQGDWICYTADDCTFAPGSLDGAIKCLSTKDWMSVVSGKYA